MGEILAVRLWSYIWPLMRLIFPITGDGCQLFVSNPRRLRGRSEDYSLSPILKDPN